ncbi:MAG: nucleotide-binding universal stress UspA family protein [Polyangiales bacterium]|jgi:nucleotide-binding universal stress UspA family protein
MKTILCATDLGESGATALAWAAAWARDTNAELTLLHVDGASHAPLEVPESIRAAAETFASRLDDRRAAHETSLAANLASLDLQCKLRIATGRPWEATLRVADEINADLIVVGPHTGGLGSTARRIVTHAQRPVLVARGAAPTNLAGLRWVVGVPLSSGVPPLVAHVDALAKTNGGRLSLVRALPMMGALYVETPLPDLQDQIRDSMLNYLAGIAEQLESPVDVHSAAGEAAYLLDHIANEGDILAMATHEMGTLERLVLGSVTERVLRTSAHSVYIEPAEQNG